MLLDNSERGAIAAATSALAEAADTNCLVARYFSGLTDAVEKVGVFDRATVDATYLT
jgi:hypothetical protein